MYGLVIAIARDTRQVGSEREMKLKLELKIPDKNKKKKTKRDSISNLLPNLLKQVGAMKQRVLHVNNDVCQWHLPHLNNPSNRHLFLSYFPFPSPFSFTPCILDTLVPPSASPLTFLSRQLCCRDSPFFDLGRTPTPAHPLCLIFGRAKVRTCLPRL